jgi:O-antigen/teichoic acid export membrane protein
MRLFGAIPVILVVVLAPLWPAFREALVVGDVAWARRTLSTTIKAGLAITFVPTVLLLVFGTAIIHWWAGPEIDPTPLLLASLGVGSMLSAVVTALSYFLAGANALVFQTVVFSLMAVANIVISVALTHELGVSGVVIGTATSQFAFLVVPCLVYIPRLLRRLEDAAAVEPAVPAER